MTKVIDDNFMVCTDCLMAIANWDFSGLDYYLEPEDSEKRVEEIKHGIDSINGYICVGDSEKDNEFSSRPCECCGCSLAGSRYHCVVLD